MGDRLDYSLIDSINESASVKEMQQEYEMQKEREYKQDMQQAKVFCITLFLAIVLVGLVEALWIKQTWFGTIYRSMVQLRQRKRTSCILAYVWGQEYGIYAISLGKTYTQELKPNQTGLAYLRHMQDIG